MNLPKPLSLAVFMVAMVPVFVASPVQAGNAVMFSCSVSVLYAPSTVTFYVSTTITSTGGYLPTPELDYLQSFHAGLLFNSQAPQFNIPNKATTFKFTIPVSYNGSGSFSWISTPLAVKGHSDTQLAQCVAYFNVP